MDIRIIMDAPAAGQAKRERLITEAVAQWARETYGLAATHLNVTFEPMPLPTAESEAGPVLEKEEAPATPKPPAAHGGSKKKKPSKGGVANGKERA